MEAGDRALLLPAFADEVDRVAGNLGSTEVPVYTLRKAFGVATDMEIVMLRPLGLPLYRSDGWKLDSRAFRRWATGRTVTPPSRPPRRRVDEESV